MPKLLMVSWKDIRHPRGGGAETYTLTVLEGLARLGYDVTWLAPHAPGHPRREITPAGVEIDRFGSLAVHIARTLLRLSTHPREFDIVIDQINTIPMLTRFVVPERKGLVLMHQLAATVWEYETHPFVARLGRFLEPKYLAWYRSWPAIVVSDSTRADLQRLGFDRVSVVENSLTFDLPPWTPREQPNLPHFVGLGRLVPMKRFELLLEAFNRVQAHLPGARLTLIGRGNDKYAQDLRARVERTPNARLLSNATDEVKQEVLRNATAVVATSIREGWGLMITEGHAYGTPSVALDVPGLRDSTRHGVDGLLARDLDDLVETMHRMHSDSAMWQRFSLEARKSAERMTPERQVLATHRALQTLKDLPY